MFKFNNSIVPNNVRIGGIFHQINMLIGMHIQHSRVMSRFDENSLWIPT